MRFDQMLVTCVQMRQQLNSISGGASDPESLEDVLESEGSDHHSAEQLHQQQHLLRPQPQGILITLAHPPTGPSFQSTSM